MKTKKKKLNRNVKKGFIKEVILKLDLEKSVDCFHLYVMKKEFQEGEHWEHRDLKAHG